MGKNCFLNSISSFRSDNYWIIDLQAPLLFHLTLTSHRSLFSSCSTPRSNNCTNMVALFRIVLNAFKLVHVQWHEKAFCPFQISLVFTYLSHFQVIKQMLLLQKYNLSKYKMQFIMGKKAIQIYLPPFPALAGVPKLFQSRNTSPGLDVFLLQSRNTSNPGDKKRGRDWAKMWSIFDFCGKNLCRPKKRT